MRQIDELLAKLQAMSPGEQAAIREHVIEETDREIWMPNLGPQTTAYFSQADILLYGGQGGGGKTDLLAGLALTKHRRSLIMRPQYTDLSSIIERFTAVAGTTAGLNRSPPAKFRHDGRLIEFGAASDLDAAKTWQGNPHDLIGFDEACQFLEPVVRFVLGWNRAADEQLGHRSTQRTRAVLASNTPLGAEGSWIIGMFRPWLDDTYGDPAEHGELRWYITDPDGRDMEVDGPEDVREFTGDDGVTKTYTPHSRTFIPAQLGDNPFLAGTGYQATLDAMPEPMRSAIRDGNFMAAREEGVMQTIPTSWVLAANERWRNGQRPDMQMSSIGLDVARGGRDQTVLARRYGVWFEELIAVPGRETPDGPTVAALAAAHLREGAIVGVDNIGVGADAETSLKNAGLPFEAMNGAEGSTAHTRDGAFGFKTYRSEMWWMLREALDPDYGLNLALPPDPSLMADLISPTYEVTPGQPPKILVESTPKIMKRLHRSPDKGSAVVYAWNSGAPDIFIGAAGQKRGKVLHTPAPVEDYDPRSG